MKTYVWEYKINWQGNDGRGVVESGYFLVDGPYLNNEHINTIVAAFLRKIGKSMEDGRFVTIDRSRLGILRPED